MRRKRDPRGTPRIATLLASFENIDGAELEIAAGAAVAAELELEAGEAKVPRFRMVAYTGAPMRFPHLTPHPVFVDLDGIRAASDPVPIFREHDPQQRVGHGSIRVEAGELIAEGLMSGAGKAAEETRAEAKRGFPFQASIGARIVRAEFVRKGKRATVNGRSVTGPVLIARVAEVFEVSWVSIGRDSATSSRLAAMARKGRTMKDFEKWLEGLGFEASELTDSQRSNLLATYEREAGTGTAPGSASPTPTATLDDEDARRREADAMIRAEREQFARERERVAFITDHCGNEHAAIAAEAIRDGWTTERAELEVMRATRGTSGTRQTNTSTGGGAGETREELATLEAAMLLSLGHSEEEVLAGFSGPNVNGERVVENARHNYSGIGLLGLALECASLEGVAPASRHQTHDIITAGVSTSSLSGVISNVVSKAALRQYQMHPITALSLCHTRSVPDFKQIENYRLDGTGAWAPVGKGGRIEHGKLSDTRYENKADLFAQVISIDYRDFVNDNMGMLADTGRALGRSGSEIIDDLFAKRLLGNAPMEGGTFFSAGNGNLTTGAGSAFGAAGLAAARLAFRKRKAGPGTKAKDQKPINVTPTTLLVPPELETDAEQLMNSLQLLPSGSSDRDTASNNPWRDKYGLTVMPHLSDSFYTGSSSAAWYLMADPELAAALELVFLNDRRSPTIERVDTPADEIGLRYRGVFACGCNFQDPKAAQKMAGS